MAERRLSLQQAVELIFNDEDEFVELTGQIDDTGADAPSDQQEIPDSDSDAESQHEPSDEEDDEDEDEMIGEIFDKEGCFPSKIAGVTWSPNPPTTRGRTAAANVLHTPPGPTDIVPKDIPLLPIDTFWLCFTPRMRDIVLVNTNNAYMEYSRANPNKLKRFGGYRPFTQEEIDAFVGLLVIQGAFKAGRRTPHELWGDMQPPHFRATMSRDRFYLLLMFCRFDDKNTRPARLPQDCFTHIRELWDSFNTRARELYIPGPCVTIDEQLVKFRGRCRFRQFMINKPGKYGLKIWILADADNFYCYNAIPYLGKQDTTAGTGMGARVVKALAAPLYGSGRNITMDRYFTSVDVAEDMIAKNLTVVGTIQANRRGLPLALLPAAAKGREVGSTMFAYRDKVTVASYKAKKTRTVLMLSTMHHDKAIDENGKPEIIMCYNATKVGVDVLDQMIRHYSAYRRNYRWPFAIFCNILNIVGINGRVLFNWRAGDRQGAKKMTRYAYLMEVGLSLIRPAMEIRAETGRCLRETTILALKCFGIAMANQRAVRNEVAANNGDKKVCYVCPRAKRRKAKQVCLVCRRNICNDHSETVLKCYECLGNGN